MTTPSRYIVGIDLGTTNSVVAYVDTQDEELPIRILRIPQLTTPGNVEERTTLPSFLYIPTKQEFPEGSLALPWTDELSFAVGTLARTRGAEVPGRLISSAKSWLCHTGMDRTTPILPWDGGDEVRKMSPLEAAAQYLAHIRQAWNAQMVRADSENSLEQQDVFLTVPASFDAVARELTVQAAERAGFVNVTLLEEPQAACYSWIDQSGDAWRKQVRVGDIILACDIGGGTTDFSLIAVAEQDGELELERIAVGDHILLGGDNMDLALAYAVQQRLAQKGTRLDAWQLRGLSQNCRAAKESLLQLDHEQNYPLTILGRGKSVIGGALRTELSYDEVEKVLVDGFFPCCTADERPQTSRRVGFQEIGLPYAAEAGVTRHLAKFLAQHVSIDAETGTFLHPTALLLNGGTLKAALLQDRLVRVVNTWLEKDGGEPLRVLEGIDLDHAVARGAAAYGRARRGHGVRIRGGTARSYYIGIESSMPAVPGMPAPLKALCTVPFGMEEGTECDISGQEFGLIVGEPAEFRFFGSTTRREDRLGDLIEAPDEEVEALSPLETTLSWAGREGTLVPVRLRAHVTAVGTIELWAVATDENQRWKLEFNVRTTEG